MDQKHTEFSSRFAIDPIAASAMGTDELRHNFHVAGLFQPGLVTGNFYLFLFRFQGDWMSALDFLFLNQAPHQCDNIDIFPVF